MPLSDSLRLSLPDLITLACWVMAGTTPAFFSTPRSISVSVIFSRSDSRTSALNLAMAELKPRLGRRRWIGIWPPSNPILPRPPLRARWPLWPRPAVLPMPEPIPRPTRTRTVLAPLAGLMLLSFMSDLFHLQHERRLADHAEILRGRRYRR